SNTGLIPNPAVTYTSPANSGFLTFTPVHSSNGVVTISVFVKDNGGTANGGIDSVTNTFTITVTPVNDTPTLDPIGNLTVLEDPGPQTVLLTGISKGPANESSQTLTFTATSS